MIVVGRRHVDRVRAAAVAAYPEECCGLLVGRVGPGGAVAVTGTIAARNVAEDGHRHDRFEVDPQARFDLMRALGDGPERLVGHYHSHPDHPAVPSASDRRRAWEPELAWLIVSVGPGGAAEMRAWRFDSATGDFRKVVLDIADDPGP